MTDPPPITQCDAAVVIRTPAMLAAAYRATLAGIARRRRDGLPTGDLAALGRALFRAHAAAMSPPRHDDAAPRIAAPPSEGQDVLAIPVLLRTGNAVSIFGK